MDQGTVRRREAERLRQAIATSGEISGQAPLPAPNRDPALIALLANIRSLWNVGSIFRSADGAGIGRLVLTGITGTPPRPEIAKTALGAEDVVPWIYEADPAAAARRIKAEGFRLLVLETGPRARPLATLTEVAGPVCLVLGHELAGVSPELLDLADELVCLPMRGAKRSLNVAVAFGIAAYHLASAREALRP
jgi:tRNA G18 (ribose-2'-O)-methylase SpoU